MNLNSKKTWLAAALVFAVVSLRLIEHPFNATPMVAVILFSAAAFSSWKWKMGVPFVALILSDVALQYKTGMGFHSSAGIVYLSFALILALGFFTLRKVNVLRIAGVSVASSVLFFLITNFALFYPAAPVSNPAIGAYSHDLAGIMASYQAGLPFFKNMLVGDLAFSGLLFGAYAMISKALGLKVA